MVNIAIAKTSRQDYHPSFSSRVSEILTTSVQNYFNCQEVTLDLNDEPYGKVLGTMMAMNLLLIDGVTVHLKIHSTSTTVKHLLASASSKKRMINPNEHIRELVNLVGGTLHPIFVGPGSSGESSEQTPPAVLRGIDDLALTFRKHYQQSWVWKGSIPHRESFSLYASIHFLMGSKEFFEEFDARDFSADDHAESQGLIEMF